MVKGNSNEYMTRTFHTRYSKIKNIPLLNRHLRLFWSMISSLQQIKLLIYIRCQLANRLYEFVHEKNILKLHLMKNSCIILEIQPYRTGYCRLLEKNVSSQWSRLLTALGEIKKSYIFCQWTKMYDLRWNSYYALRFEMSCDRCWINPSSSH